MNGWIEWIIVATEERLVATEERLVATEERFISVYRLVPDAKPDRGMM